jgi:hypothetical protein
VFVPMVTMFKFENGSFSPFLIYEHGTHDQSVIRYNGGLFIVGPTMAISEPLIQRCKHGSLVLPEVACGAAERRCSPQILEEFPLNLDGPDARA